MHPVFLFHADGVNDVSQIILGVGEDKCSVTYIVAPIGANGRFCSGRNVCGKLSCVDCWFASSQADETLIKMIEPRAQRCWAVASRIGSYKNHLELFCGAFRYFLKSLSDHCHLGRTHVRTVGISEEQKCDVSLSLRPEFILRSRRVGQSKSRLRQRRADQSSTVCRFSAIGSSRLRRLLRRLSPQIVGGP